MAGEQQCARGRGVQGGNDVGEGDQAAGGRRLEGVQVHGPAGRQRGQSGGDVLKQSGNGGEMSRSKKWDKKRRESVKVFRSHTHLPHLHTALCAWEPLDQDGPQVSLPQTSPVHLRDQPANLSRGDLTGFVRQLGKEIKINEEDADVRGRADRNRKSCSVWTKRERCGVRRTE